MLKQTGAEVNVKDRWGKSPLQLSIYQNNTHMIKVLQGAGALLDSREAEYDLFQAARHG